ncbi:MAG: cytochrome c oxidase assembly factor Coa1 family protein [Planctomycetaceae bacterium]
MHRLSLAFAVIVSLSLTGGCRRLSEHPLVMQGADEVRGNRQVADALGSPVTCSSTVRGTANETDGIAALQFDASGPKGAGVVVVEGKKTGGEWGVTMLELRPAVGERLSLTADLEARTGTDTPKFDPTAGPATTSPVTRPADVEIVLPPGPPVP